MRLFQFKKLFILIVIVLISSCKKQEATNYIMVSTPSKNMELKPAKMLSEDFKSYWYTGNAELTSFKLKQARYGEMRDGHAVLIYVTEDFLPEKQVKADRPNSESISVLKLNSVKKFNTGIYPYSIMQSSFFPVDNNQHALKVSSSIQEWCGHVYSQINNRDSFEVMSHSYFEGEADDEFSFDKTNLENEVWNQLRIDPTSLPDGEIEMVPSLEFLRMKHLPIKAYKAQATLNEGQYEINYYDISRTLTIIFNDQFPYDILRWEETFLSGFGDSARKMTTSAERMRTLNLPYWQLNSNANEVLQDSLFSFISNH